MDERTPLLSGRPRHDIKDPADSTNQQETHHETGINYYQPNVTQVSQQKTAVYARRWYLVFLMMLTGFLQCLNYSTWGPITKSAISAFNWKNSDLAMMPNWANIAFVLVQVPASWFLDTKGLRWSSLLMSCLLVASAGLRCLPFDPVSESYKWSVFSGQIMCGVAFVFVGGGATTFSSTWFPPNQRTLSTILIITGYQLGGAFAFFIGPLAVPESTNSTIPINVTNMMSNETDLTPVERERNDIMNYMYAQLIASGVLFLLVLLYFPARPPLPPSISAKAGREDVVQGFKDLCRMPSFWTLAVAFGCLGGFMGWIPVLDIDLESQQISQVDIGWVGFWAQLAGIVFAVPAAWLSAVLAGRLKQCIVLSMLLTTGFFVFFTAMNQAVIGLKPTLALLYVSSIGSFWLANLMFALFLEMSCEHVYPISEAVTTGSLCIANSLGGMLFFFLFLVPNIGTVWIDWFVLGSLVICLAALLMVKIKYRRSQVDTRLNSLPEEDILTVDSNG